MKKRIIIIALLALVLVTGCSLKKETKTETKKTEFVTSLEGKFKLTDPSRDNTVYQGFNKYLTYEGDNVTLYDEYDESTYTGTYTIEDNKIVMKFTKFKDNSGEKTVTYELSGKAAKEKVTVTQEIKNDLITIIKDIYKIEK